ncbi:MAG TPA: HNH endonuclease domain-containing protein [Candidatus Thermoplasmatota archaeon]|nr:HNH endonuclease domain-containing protein [Candidatus Thermoplasmatota archaeon]
MANREPDKVAWQWIVQLGRNSSTYKLALASELLRHANAGLDRIPLSDLAAGFRDAYRDRVARGRPQQPIAGRWTVVERNILQQDANASLDLVREEALRNMVLQKFHNLDRGVQAPRFFEDPEDGNVLLLTPRLLGLVDGEAEMLRREALSRWDLLEHAFTAANPEAVTANELLGSIETRQGRVSLTHLIPALSPYQRDRCFYCGGELDRIHVDHVLPHALVGHNELWNLVLADDVCNGNKSDQLPTRPMIDRLVSRNEALIRSMNPLRNSLIDALGNTGERRSKTMLAAYARCLKMSPRIWTGGRDDSMTMLQEYAAYVRSRSG